MYCCCRSVVVVVFIAVAVARSFFVSFHHYYCFALHTLGSVMCLVRRESISSVESCLPNDNNNNNNAVLCILFVRCIVVKSWNCWHFVLNGNFTQFYDPKCISQLAVCVCVHYLERPADCMSMAAAVFFSVSFTVMHFMVLTIWFVVASSGQAETELMIRIRYVLVCSSFVRLLFWPIWRARARK